MAATRARGERPQTPTGLLTGQVIHKCCPVLGGADSACRLPHSWAQPEVRVRRGDGCSLAFTRPSGFSQSPGRNRHKRGHCHGSLGLRQHRPPAWGPRGEGAEPCGFTQLLVTPSAAHFSPFFQTVTHLSVAVCRAPGIGVARVSGPAGSPCTCIRRWDSALLLLHLASCGSLTLCFTVPRGVFPRLNLITLRSTWGTRHLHGLACLLFSRDQAMTVFCGH